MIHCLKRARAKCVSARAPSITKGYPLPEGSPGWLIAMRVLEGRINFRAFSSVHGATAAIPISPQQTEIKFFKASPPKSARRWRQRHGLIVKGKRISCPPQYAPPNNDGDTPHHHSGLGFPLIRSPRASTQPSTSVLFSFVLSLLIVAGSFATRQSKMIGARSLSSGRGGLRQQIVTSLT